MAIWKNIDDPVGTHSLCALLLAMSWSSAIGLLQGVLSLALTVLSIVWVCVQIRAKTRTHRK